MTQYCHQCTEEKSCGKFHVYVIKLDENVRRDYVFQLENPHLELDDSVPCYYVGMSEHKPECRFKQHTESYKQRKLYARGLAFYPKEIDCNCFFKPKRLILQPKRKKDYAFGNKIAGRYGERLVPELFAHLNPIPTRKMARDIGKNGVRHLSLWKNVS